MVSSSEKSSRKSLATTQDFCPWKENWIFHFPRIKWKWLRRFIKFIKFIMMFNVRRSKYLSLFFFCFWRERRSRKIDMKFFQTKARFSSNARANHVVIMTCDRSTCLEISSIIYRILYLKQSVHLKLNHILQIFADTKANSCFHLHSEKWHGTGTRITNSFEY